MNRLSQLFALALAASTIALVAPQSAVAAQGDNSAVDDPLSSSPTR